MDQTPKHATDIKAPPVREARGESRRQQVLDAAAICFRRNGFRGASMSEISALAGMSTGHIYHYFKNKEAIVEAIIKRDLQEGMTFMESLKEADDIVQMLVDGAKDCIVDRNKLSEPALTLEILAEASRNPAISAIMDDCETSIRRSFIEALETGRKRGVIAPDARIEVACTMMMLIFDGITVQSAVNPLFDHEVILKELERLLNQALRPGVGSDLNHPKP
ncbi:TetR/AcrR family transcriptional regulator [Telmatospirillum siberiense]|uniref:TetR family transcriptional regulator n=1 Tax=Telmatospirillum siberiense TaxID=382514 RepID=A0A2N3PT24_9PROT|nr:TetR/AcrR family transcriptional regulator [Telmatospirillum siberiense]PKU23551.1 TetR family transcriptional regulator [Telmatospirillum siberiense]